MNATKIDTHVGIDHLRSTIDEIGLEVTTGYTLADAIREGSSVTQKAEGKFLADNGNVCALSAGFIAAKARGFIA